LSSILTNFQPRRRAISAVTNAKEAQVTTTEDHGYEVGQWVRVIVPGDYGMDIDYEVAQVQSVPSSTELTVNIDTSYRLAYSTPSEPPSFTQSQIIPISGATDNATSIG